MAKKSLTVQEQQGSHGTNTFANYHNASVVGTRVNAWTWVSVSCKVYDPTIASVNPDGYWYRIASSPWNDAYYAPANTFMNGDPPGGPYTHNTDFGVPDCGTSGTPPQAPPPTTTPTPPTGSQPGGPGCPIYSGTKYSPAAIPLYVRLFGHYLTGKGSKIVLDWSFLTRDSAFVAEAKSLGVGKSIGWRPPLSDSDLFLGLRNFTIVHYTQTCWYIYDIYDFQGFPTEASAKQITDFLFYWPEWALQIAYAQVFEVRSSGTL